MRTWREYASSLAAFRLALRVASLRRVVIAFGAASAIEAIGWLAIGVYTYERSGATGVGVIGLAILLPCALAAPVAAALADRFSRQRILVIAYLTLTAAVTGSAAAIALDAPRPAIWACVTLASLAATPIRPAQGALLPSLSVAPTSLTAANVALTTVRNLGLLAGPLLAGIILRWSGPAAAFAACVPLAAMSTVLVARVPVDRRRFTLPGTAMRYLTDGARLLAREHRAAIVVGLTFGKHILMGAIRTFLVVIALGLLGMQAGGAGVLSTALGCGGFAGAGTAVLLVGRRRLTPALVQGALLLGLPIALIGLRPGVAVAIAALAACGAGRTLMDIAGRTLLSRVSPDDAVARFLGFLEGSSYAGLALGSATAAMLVHAAGIRSALIIAGAFLPLLAVILLKPLTAIDLGPLVSRDRLHLILGVPMFAPLPPETIERLAAQLEPMSFEAGALAIRQGDVGDRFYVLESGAAVVEVDDVRVATYAPGASFGEIALLHDVPRTATVRITAPSKVVALDRHHFLAVIADDPESRAEAERVAADRLLATAAHRR